MSQKCAVRVVLIASMIPQAWVATSRGEIIKEYTGGTILTRDGIYPGTSFTLPEAPGGDGWTNLRFSWIVSEDGDPGAFGGLFLLLQPYEGVPGALSAATPGFLAEGISDGIEYVFPNIILEPSLVYYFYTNDVGIILGGGSQEGTTFYASGGANETYVTFTDSIANFRLTGDVAPGPIIPEPSTLSLLGLGLAGVLGGLRPRRASRRRRVAGGPIVEPLEGRLVLSGMEGLELAQGSSTIQVALDGETLRVDGTPGPDRIWIGATGRPEEIILFANGRVLGRYGSVGQIRILTGAGTDLVLVSPQVRIPTRIEGGLGDDILRGGGGADQILGEEGNDTLFGSPGHDALDAGPGRNRVSVLQSMGVIHVTRAALGEATRILSAGYTLRPIGANWPGQLGPMVLGASDLDDPAMLSLARQAYEAGYTVALADGTHEHSHRLREAIGHVAGADWDEAVSSHSALIAYRRVARPDGAFHHSTDILMPRDGLAARAARRADPAALETLTRVFAANPILIEALPGDDVPNLAQIADSYSSSGQYTDPAGNGVQIVNYVWNARSFSEEKDFYFTFQEVDYTIASTFEPFWHNAAYSYLFNPDFEPVIAQMSPATTMETTEDTSSIEWSISGTVGYNQGGVGEVSGGVSFTHSKTVIIPPVQITNNSNTNTGEASWEYDVRRVPDQREMVSFYNAWVWTIGKDDYNPGQDGTIQFRSYAQLLAGGWTPYVGVFPWVPMPFGEVFTLDQPVVSSVSPSTVFEGDTFTITGTGLYPPLVTAVLVGGEVLESTQYTRVSPTEIRVVAPDTFGLFLPVVVQTTVGLSNDDVEIAIIGT